MRGQLLPPSSELGRARLPSRQGRILFLLPPMPPTKAFPELRRVLLHFPPLAYLPLSSLTLPVLQAAPPSPSQAYRHLGSPHRRLPSSVHLHVPPSVIQMLAYLYP